MNPRIAREHRWIAASTLCLLVAGSWAVWRTKATAASSAASHLSLLATLPANPSGSATDAALVRCAARVRHAPRDAPGWTELGDALVQKSRDTADLRCLAHAERVFREALSLDARSAGAMLGMAWVASTRHEFEQSTEWARRALAIEPKNEGAHGLLGDAAVELGDYPGALRHYQRMLDLQPNLASYSRGAHLLHLIGDGRKAAWLMGKAIEAGAPYGENTLWCRAQLALMLWSRGSLVAAEKLLVDSLRAAPGNHYLLAALGRVRGSRRDYAGAIEAYRKAVEIVPQHESLAALGDLYALTGRQDEAEACYAQVEALHRLNQASGVRGDAQIALFYADHDRRLPDALRLAEGEYRSRRNVYAADALAWCLYKNGRLREAKQTIKEALRLRTPEARFLFHAGMIHAALGERAAAQRSLYRAQSLNSCFDPRLASVAEVTLKRLAARRS